MKPKLLPSLLALFLMLFCLTMHGQSRRPIDNRHPLWMIHIDVWNKADPQKIIDLIPEDIKPYVCLNLSLSCQYDTKKNVYKMPQNAVYTYKSWASVCQKNKMWFTCQPASGGHTHIQDDDISTFEYFFKHYPNFLGWNYAEQFWGFDEPNDKSSSTQNNRIALFAKLVPMAHQYGGFLTISFCGNIWSHALNPNGMLKRNADLLRACQQYPEAILWLYKYTTSTCFYNNESVTIAPFISGLAKNYGVRYDNCGWDGSVNVVLGKDSRKKYPEAVGIGTVLEQMAMNGACVWDGPELIWTQDFQSLNNTQVDGYTRRNWGTFPGFDNVWIDMFRKVLDGTIYIPSREEVVNKTKLVIVNDVNSGNDEDKYAAWGDLYDGLYKVDDPFNKDDGRMNNNGIYFKKSGRYGTIPVVTGLYDEKAEVIPNVINKSTHASRWSTIDAKVEEFNRIYPEVSKGDLYVQRYKNQLVTYTPYTYVNEKTSATAEIPLQYNSCDKLLLTYARLSSGLIKEYADHLEFYLNNYRSDSTATVTDRITIMGCTTKPDYAMIPRVNAKATGTEQWNAKAGVFTLDINHNGAVDLTINSRGSKPKNNNDLVTTTKTYVEKPLQPRDFDGKLIIEAEDMDYKSVKKVTVNPYGEYPDERGHSGNGFVNMGANKAGSLRHTTHIKKAGAYRVTLKYLAPHASNIELKVNGKSYLAKMDACQPNEWKKLIISTDLIEGENTLYINNVEGNACYIDQFTYTPAEMAEEKYQVTILPTDFGSALPNVGKALEGDKVKLIVTPRQDYALTGWEIVHGNVTIGEDNGFIMPDDNVTLRPIFVNTTEIYKLDYTNVSSSTMPQGWVATSGTDIHEYPASYGSGPRTFAGFRGFQGKALYWRAGTAEYGTQPNYRLQLDPGKYILHFAMAAWKGTPNYKASLNKIDGTQVAQSKHYTATPNAYGSQSADVTSASVNTLEFMVTEKGNYLINFTSEAGFPEFLLLDCHITRSETDGIARLVDQKTDSQVLVTIYDTAGVRLDRLQRGINIVRYSDGSTRKIMMR